MSEFRGYNLPFIDLNKEPKKINWRTKRKMKKLNKQIDKIVKKSKKEGLF